MSSLGRRIAVVGKSRVDYSRSSTSIRVEESGKRWASGSSPAKCRSLTLDVHCGRAAVHWLDPSDEWPYPQFSMLGNVLSVLTPAVSIRNEDRRSTDNPCTPIGDIIPQISDHFRADTRQIKFEISYHHRRATKTSDSGCMQEPAVPDRAKTVSGNVAILAGADNGNLLRSSWQLCDKSR